jgi:hypothetical protein
VIFVRRQFDNVERGALTAVRVLPSVPVVPMSGLRQEADQHDRSYAMTRWYIGELSAEFFGTMIPILFGVGWVDVD